MSARAELSEAERLDHLGLALSVAGLSAPDVSLPESRHVHIQNLRFHYLDWGGRGRAPILFLHGGGQSAHTWDLVCAVLRSEHRCVALDQRGHGDSDWSDSLDYAFETHTRDVEGLISHLGLERFFVVGMSMGGLNALLYAAAHPERLRGLVLVDCGPDVQAPGGARIVDFVLQIRSVDSLDTLIAQALEFNPSRDPRLLRRSLLHTFRQQADGTWVRKNDTRHWHDSDPAQRVARLKEYWPLVSRITCPTLVVRGAHSDVFHDADAAKLARELPDGRWVRVENAGHTVQGDNPRGLLAELRSFFTHCSRGSP